MDENTRLMLWGFFMLGANAATTYHLNHDGAMVWPVPQGVLDDRFSEILQRKPELQELRMTRG